MNLSIVLPYYEKKASLKIVLDELKLQINPTDEILIVDDWSPNGLPEIDCPCTKVVRPEKQEPHTYRLNTLRNLGLSSASSDACIILDPDCVPNPNFLKNARFLFDPSVVFSGAIDFVQEDNSIMLDPRGGEIRRSKWVDLNEQYGIGIMIWGGCMMFSKSRTQLTGWFDEGFNGNWGTEEHEFASRCYHGGLRLFYSIELQVTHLWHPKVTPDKGKNPMLWREKVEQHREMLDRVTNYRPTVAILVPSLLRPYYIDQCMRAIFRNNLAVRVYLVNQGDASMEQMEVLKPWRNRWSIKVVDNKENIHLPALINEAMRWAKQDGCKYLVIIHDDVMVGSHSIESLIRVMEEHPEYYAISSLFRDENNVERMAGGYIIGREYFDLEPIQSIHQVDYISSGLIVMRLDPLAEYDPSMELDWSDWFWCELVKEKGLKLAVCGDAKAYHHVLWTSEGAKNIVDSPEYQKVRTNVERTMQMVEYFKKRWGWIPTIPKVLPQNLVDAPRDFVEKEFKKEGKIKVLSIIDTYGWAWDIASKELFNNLPERYIGRVLNKNDFLSQNINANSFDIILLYTFMDDRVLDKVNSKNTIICIAGWEDLDKKVMWQSLQRFKYFGACNEKIAKIIRQMLPNKTVWLLSHGVDAELFKPASEKPKGFMVGWVGNQFRKIKRLYLARESVAKVEGAELKVAGLVGSPEYRKREKMPEFYRDLSCLLVTSGSEAHSLVVYEALASGLPVISTRTGDTDENIIDGVNGFLLPVDCTVEQIVPILIKLRDNLVLRDKMGIEARRTVLEKWTWSKVSKSYIDAFERVWRDNIHV